MNKFAAMLACGAMAASTVALGQAVQDPCLQANAGNAVVQTELNQPDGVAFAIRPDGTFLIFAHGTGMYDFNDAEDIREARKAGTLRAKANLSKFLKEKVSSSEGVDEVSKKSKYMTSDGQVQRGVVSKESVKIATESIRNESEAILSGLVVLKDRKVPRRAGGEIQVTVGISSKTLKAARMAARGVNQSLADREAPAGGAPAAARLVPTPSPLNTPETRTADTDF